MKNTSHKKWYALLACIFIIIILGMLSILWFYKYKANENLIKYKAYLIEIESSEYSPDTRCGRIDIIVKNSKNSSDKLFTVKDDVISNGNMKVVDGDYGLRVARDDVQAEIYTQELKFENNMQHIAIKYINVAENPQDDCAKIQIVKFPNATLEKEFETEKDSKTDSIKLSAGKRSGTIFASTQGMLIDNEGMEKVHIFNLKVRYKDGRENILFLANEFNWSEKKTNYVQVSYENDNLLKYYYCWDFGDLQNIEYIEVDKNFYRPIIP